MPERAKVSPLKMITLAFVDSINKSEKKEEKTEGEKGKELLIVCSSDRGLCGAIHSSLSKLTKRIVRARPADVQVAIVGDKAKPQIAREASKNILLSFSQVGKNNPNYSEASILATEVLKQIQSLEDAPQTMRILYNKFQTVISYENSSLHPLTPKAIREAPGIVAYAEEEPMSEETLQNFFEFNLANLLYWGLVEGHASEMASRRMAMENATKNAEQIVLNLTMRYNRTRQAVITNELVDIITGASAL